MRENTEERVGHLGAYVGQIVIIGGGPAGYEAALVAAQLDADVTIVEADGAGGACVLSDCVPSKAFIAASDVVTGYRDTEEFGVHAGGLAAVSVDAPAVHGRVKRLARAQSADIHAKLVKAGVDVVAGRAVLGATTAGHTHRVEVTPADRAPDAIDAATVLIATAGDPPGPAGPPARRARVLDRRPGGDPTRPPGPPVLVGFAGPRPAVA